MVWATNSGIPVRNRESNETVDFWNVTGVVTAANVNSVELRVQNNDNNKKTKQDYIYVEVTFTVGPPPNQPPTANAGPDQSAPVGTSVNFDGSGSSDPDGTITSYSWNFGDGSPNGSGATVSHSYTAAGTYTVTLTVTDNDGATGSDTAVVTVDPPNQPPTANAGPDQSAPVGTSVNFDGSGSSDPDGTITSYSWNFGDGSPNGSGATVSHSYTAAGTYTVTLTVTDNDGATGSDTAVVTVDPPNQPPVVQEITLQVKEGYDEKNSKRLSEEGKLTFVQANDMDRFETLSDYFTSFEFDSFPTTAEIQSVEISVVHYEEDSFGVDKLEWGAGVGLLTNPKILLVRKPALLIDESSEGLEVFDVSSVIDTLAKLNDLKCVVRNNDLANGKKTFSDHIFVTVRYTDTE